MHLRLHCNLIAIIQTIIKTALKIYKYIFNFNKTDILSLLIEDVARMFLLTFLFLIDIKMYIN